MFERKSNEFLRAPQLIIFVERSRVLPVMPASHALQALRTQTLASTPVEVRNIIRMFATFAVAGDPPATDVLHDKIAPLTSVLVHGGRKNWYFIVRQYARKFQALNPRASEVKRSLDSSEIGEKDESKAEPHPPRHAQPMRQLPLQVDAQPNPGRAFTATKVRSPL